MRQLITALVAGGLAACSQSLPLRSFTPVRVAIHQDPIAFLPVRVSQTLGYFTEDGLAVETSEVVGGTKAMQALLGGSVDVAFASISDAVQLAAEGRDVRSFLLFYTRPTAALAVAPALSGTIRTIGDLKGRTIGVSAPGTASHQILNALLVSNGLSPADVSTVSIGTSTSSVAALEHGSVDAAILLASAITAFEQRNPNRSLLVDIRTPAGARQVFGAETFPTLALLAEDKWLRANPDTARRLVRAITRGMQWVRSHPAGQVREMIPEGSRMSADGDHQTIRELQGVLSSDGVVDAKSMAMVEKFVAVSNPKVKATSLDLTRVYTNEFLPAR